jgi:hypothetical protein
MRRDNESQLMRRLDVAVATTRTDSEGAFRVGGLDQTALFVRARWDGFDDATMIVRYPSAKGLELKLQKLGWIEATVLDETGRPWKGQHTIGLGAVPYVSMFRVLENPIEFENEATLDVVDGVARSKGLRAASWFALHVVGGSGGLEPGGLAPIVVTSGGPTRDVVIRLVRGARISGRFADAKTHVPIEGGRLLAQIRSARTNGGLRYGSVRSDAEGHCAAEGLAAGRWELYATADGYAPLRDERSLAESEAFEATILLDRPTALSIRVVDRAGAPQPLAEVTMTRDGKRIAAAEDDDESMTPRIYGRLPDGMYYADKDGTLVLHTSGGRVRLTAHRLMSGHEDSAPFETEARAGETSQVTLIVPDAKPGR